MAKTFRADDGLAALHKDVAVLCLIIAHQQCSPDEIREHAPHYHTGYMAQNE